MQVNLSVETGRSEELDVVLAGPAGTTLGELMPSLHEHLHLPSGSAIASDGKLLSASALLGGPGLRAGCRLRISSVADQSKPPTSMLQARIVSGPDAGRTVALNRGRYLIGRAGTDIDIDDPGLSRRHAELVVSQHDMTVQDLGSVNGTVVNGTSIGTQPTKIALDSLIEMGNSTLSVVLPRQSPALVRADDNGSLLVHRPPRIIASGMPPAVEFPLSGSPSARPRTRWLGALAPAALATVLAIGMHSSQFLIFALFSPVSVAITAVTDRREWRRDIHRKKTQFVAAEKRAQDELDARLTDERDRRRDQFSDPAAVLHTVGTPDCRLWERQASDWSFLRLRLGLADLPAETVARRGGQELCNLTATAVPATVPLATGPLGISGPLSQTRGIARWLVAQILACHEPRDVAVIALLDGHCADWHWLRWPRGTQAIASDQEQRQQLLDELLELVRRRRLTSDTTGDNWLGPWIVLLIDPMDSMTELIGLREVLTQGSAVGITAICVASDVRLLPASCRGTVAATGDSGTLFEVSSTDSAPLTLNAERVSSEWAGEFGRSLAPLVDLESAQHTIADQVDPIELLQLGDLSEQSILQLWQRDDLPPSCPIGRSSGGVFELDLERDGPHALVAGTTGSGKSELLRSMVIGLAVRHPPHALTFVLIDYKGGATFAACTKLPHTLGVLTDLDAHLTKRALLSLTAELHRRELAFARAGAADLSGYRASAAAVENPIPRLVLIVDEFATLADELPDFLSGLLGIAQRGRSLGLHLVLATQRPAGVVSLDIKANMSLRIALRVTDSGESADVIGDDAAARISRKTPGRALARLADGELVEFQTARIGSLWSNPTEVRLSKLDFWHTGPADQAPDGGPGTLNAVCEVLAVAGAQLDRPVARPWLPPLPAVIVGPELADYGADPFEIPIGLTDDPARQRQFVTSLDLAAGGSIGFVGGARSGRSSALRSIMGLAASRLNAAQLHLYVIDCASSGFDRLRELPHCGTVVSHDEPGSIERLIERLRTELTERQKLLVDAGAGNAAEARRMGIELPALLVAVDSWDALAMWSDEQDGGRSADDLIQLLRAAPAAGFTFIVAGDRGCLGQRIGSALGRKLLLPMTDRADYAMVGIDPTGVPATRRPGRVIAADDGLETQLALLAGDPTAAAQWSTLRSLAIQDHPGENGPSIVLRPLPGRIGYTELRTAAGDAEHREAGCMLGVGGDEANPVSCDLFAERSRFLISGPARSGRSNTAALIADQARSAGLELVIAATSWSPLAEWARSTGCQLLTPEDPHCRPIQQGSLIVIDDAEQFFDCASGDRLQAALARHHGPVVATTRSENLHVSFRGIAVELRRNRTGLLLQPSLADGELLGIRLTPGGLPTAAGRGLLITDRTRAISPSGLVIQVAMADG